MNRLIQASPRVPSAFLQSSTASAAGSRLVSSVSDRVYENSALSGFQKSHLAPLPPTYRFDPSAYQTVPTKISTLSNGMRVATETTPSDSVTIAVQIEGGSRYESREANGAAHFLEHLTFKGTTNRNQAQIEAEIEHLGGNLNAFTSRENTVYLARVLKKNVPYAVDILSDILLNSELKESAIEAEREVILREMEEVNKIPEEVLMDMLHSTAYNRSSLGLPILGSAENVRKISRNDILNYIKANYTAPRFSLIGCGGIEHDYLAELGEKAFGSLRKTPEATPQPEERSVFIGSDLRYRDDSEQKVHFALAFEGVPWSHGDSVAQMVLQAMLGSYSSSSALSHSGSPMVSQLASEKLTESATAFNTFYKDTSLLGVHGVCEPEQISDACWIILREMVNMAHKASDEEVLRGHNYLKTALLLSLDDHQSIVDDIGRQIAAYGRRMSVAEIFARVDAVDPATVRRVASTLINDRDLAIAATGPLFAMPDYNWFRRRTYMLRY